MKSKKIPAYLKYYLSKTRLDGLVFNKTYLENLSGTSFYLDHSIEDKIKINLKASESTQGENPTPDNPQDIRVIKGDNEVVIENKNLFDYSDTERVYPYTLSCANVKPNTTYYIKAYNITGSYTGTHVLYTKINNEWVLNSSIVLINGFSFTTPENCTKIGLNGLTDPNIEVCQVELGTQATPYTEHKEQNYPLNLGVKNLFNKETAISALLNTDGTTTSSQTLTTSDFIEVDSSKTYYKSISDSARVKFYDNSKNVISTSSYSDISDFGGARSFTIPYNNAKYIRFSMTNARVDTMQIEEGSVAHSYTPYGITPIEMCKIGNYADEIFKNVPECEYYDSTLEIGKWYKYGRIGKVVLDGSENWVYTLSNNRHIFYHDITGKITSNVALLCSHYKYSSLSWQLIESNYICEENGNNVIFIRDDTINSANDFKNWLSTHNTKVYYILATPTKTLLSDTLQTQLDNIYNNAHTYDKITNVEQVNEDRPFILDISYYRKVK